MAATADRTAVRVGKLGIAGIVFVLVLAGVGAMAFGVGPDGRIEDLSVQVALNDELNPQTIEGGEDGVVTCSSFGPPPDYLSVRLDGVIEDPSVGDDLDLKTEYSYDLLVEVGNLSKSREVTVHEGGREPIAGAVVIEDDESLAPGDEVTVTVALRAGGRTLDSASRSTTVRNESQRCVDERD